jgi:hypothetical protein
VKILKIHISVTFPFLLIVRCVVVALVFTNAAALDSVDPVSIRQWHTLWHCCEQRNGTAASTLQEEERPTVLPCVIRNDRSSKMR